MGVRHRLTARDKVPRRMCIEKKDRGLKNRGKDSIIRNIMLDANAQ
jgi:hypothetical protein